MALTTRADIPQLLLPTLNAVISKMPTYGYQYNEIYKTHKSGKSQETDVEMKPLGLAMEVAEGAPIGSDSVGERIITNYVHKRIGLSFPVTQVAIEDNQYENEFSMGAESLRESMKIAKDIYATNPLNNGFNPANPTGDGQPIFSLHHPVDGGVYANRLPVPAGLSERALESLIMLIQKFPMQNGLLSQTMAEKLIVPRELQFVASRITNSRFKTDVGDNDINAIVHGDYFPKGYRVNQYLDSPSAYFIITDALNGLKHFERIKLQTSSYVDPATDNVIFKAVERYSFGISNIRAIAGDPGA